LPLITANADTRTKVKNTGHWSVFDWIELPILPAGSGNNVDGIFRAEIIIGTPHKIYRITRIDEYISRCMLKHWDRDTDCRDGN
jgi:hypothetical protein